MHDNLFLEETMQEISKEWNQRDRREVMVGIVKMMSAKIASQNPTIGKGLLSEWRDVLSYLCSHDTKILEDKRELILEIAGLNDPS